MAPNDQDENMNETPGELETLKARADMLGVTYHPNIGLEKLRAKVAAAMADPSEDQNNSDEDKADVPNALAAAVVETIGQRRIRMQQEAGELIRIRLTCMNPAKREWEGEIITAGNSTVGTHKKFVPFNAPEGWHVPRIIYNQLVERECQIFVSAKDSRGNTTRQGRLIKEFAIEILPQLTTEELTDLAHRQAMSKSIG